MRTALLVISFVACTYVPSDDHGLIDASSETLALDASTVDTSPTDASPDTGVPASFFGVTSGPPNDPSAFPTVHTGAVGHPGLLAWEAIEKARGVYDYSYYDAQVGK